MASIRDKLPGEDPVVFKGVSWMGVAGCFILYCVIFLAVRYEMGSETHAYSHAQLGLLMFAIPGAIAALTTKESPLTVALLGPLLATPCCLLILHLRLFSGCIALLQELAFMTSGVFWCGSGALVVMLCRSLITHQHD
ncbi:inner membrane protein YbjM [Erwinia sp. HDF1-3R]|uniref:inner membrane protein YbjM n=1 Tax=Erwinia sp. HDF1-3R TaxID=3141543 RepID=UPI0031F52876